MPKGEDGCGECFMKVILCASKANSLTWYSRKQYGKRVDPEQPLLVHRPKARKVGGVSVIMKHTALTNLFLSSAVAEHIFCLFGFYISCIHLAQIQSQATIMLPQGTLDWEENDAKETSQNIPPVCFTCVFVLLKQTSARKGSLMDQVMLSYTEKRDDYIFQKLSCIASIKSASFCLVGYLLIKGHWVCTWVSALFVSMCPFQVSLDFFTCIGLGDMCEYA